MSPRQTVINKRPEAFVARHKGVMHVYVPKPGHAWKRYHGLTHPSAETWCDSIAQAKTEREAWKLAAKAVKGKRARRSETRQGHNALVGARRTEAHARGRFRRELAVRLGTFVLNELEHRGQVGFQDYRTVTPRMVLSMYEARTR